VPIFGRKGCSIHAQEVLLALLRRGAEVALFSPRAEGDPTRELDRLQIHGLPLPAKGEAAVRERAAQELNTTLTEALESAGVFSFVYERYSLWSYGAMEFARHAGIPALLEVNAPLIEEQAQFRVLVDRAAAVECAERAFAAATALLAVSEEVGDWLRGFPAAHGKIHIVPNGIRPERFPETLEAALPAPPGVFTVGFVGTLKAWHGLATLVEAFYLLHGRIPQTRLVIVGDGPEREKITADVALRGLTKSTIFTGAVAPEQVPGLLASMDVAVAPYPPMEHFYFSPLKVYEYMASGRPVVASRIGQLQTVIDSERNGLLVPPGAASALAASLERLQHQAEFRLRLGKAARQTVLAKFTWEAVADKIFGLARAGTRHAAAIVSG
jgi:glycosyltransferase involved in cell wall biosynthesis